MTLTWHNAVGGWLRAISAPVCGSCLITQWRMKCVSFGYQSFAFTDVGTEVPP